MIERFETKDYTAYDIEFYVENYKDLTVPQDKKSINNKKVILFTGLGLLIASIIYFLFNIMFLSLGVFILLAAWPFLEILIDKTKNKDNQYALNDLDFLNTMYVKDKKVKRLWEFIEEKNSDLDSIRVNIPHGYQEIKETNRLYNQYDMASEPLKLNDANKINIILMLLNVKELDQSLKDQKEIEEIVKANLDREISPSILSLNEKAMDLQNFNKSEQQKTKEIQEKQIEIIQEYSKR